MNKYVLIGLFSFVVIGSLYLVFKDGFKLKKHDSSKQIFGNKDKEENGSDIKGTILVIGTFILFLILFDKCS